MGQVGLLFPNPDLKVDPGLPIHIDLLLRRPEHNLGTSETCTRSNRSSDHQCRRAAWLPSHLAPVVAFRAGLYKGVPEGDRWGGAIER